ASFENDKGDHEQVDYLNNQNFNYQGNNMPSNLLTHYYPSLRNYKNFSYSNTRNVLLPLEFNLLVVEKKLSLEDLLSILIVETWRRFNKDEARLDHIKIHCTNMNTTTKSLKVQIGQLTTSINR
ncbi:hypothetical protein PanWU01x14_250260, partial [Parasponia andersonii]